MIKELQQKQVAFIILLAAFQGQRPPSKHIACCQRAGVAVEVRKSLFDRTLMFFPSDPSVSSLGLENRIVNLPFSLNLLCPFPFHPSAQTKDAGVSLFSLDFFQ